MTESDADVVFAGDSITSNCHFDELLVTDRTLLNRGIRSDTTEGLFNRLGEILGHNPEVIFIMIGINDIGKDVPLVDTEKYYRLIINKIQSEIPSCKTIVQSILPTLRTDGINEKVVTANAMLAGLAREYGLEYIDLHSLFMDGQTVKNEFFSADMVHLNGEGYRIWVSELNGYLK